MMITSAMRDARKSFVTERTGIPQSTNSEFPSVRRTVMLIAGLVGLDVAD
jgi:hypothetical protein